MISHKYTPNEIFNLKKNDYALPDNVSKNLNNIYDILSSRNNNKKTTSKYGTGTWTKGRYLSQNDIHDKNKNKQDIISILNKVSNNNFESSLKTLTKICSQNSSNDYSSFITENIFKNSISQSIFCKNYVKILLTIKSEEIIQSKIREFDNFIYNEKNPKHLKSGYSSFISELFNFGLIDSNLIGILIKNIIKNILKDKLLCEDYVECLFVINKTVENREIIKEILFDDIDTMVEDKEINAKCRFKIMDIKDTLK
jgi:hypothetical protein